jgi:hypothetical protein
MIAQHDSTVIAQRFRVDFVLIAQCLRSTFELNVKRLRGVIAQRFRSESAAIAW